MPTNQIISSLGESETYSKDTYNPKIKLSMSNNIVEAINQLLKFLFSLVMFEIDNVPTTIADPITLNNLRMLQALNSIPNKFRRVKKPNSGLFDNRETE